MVLVHTNRYQLTAERTTPMDDKEQSRAIDAFHAALSKAHEAWPERHPDEPWPGYFNISPETRAELGIPEPPGITDLEPLPPHLDAASPEFEAPRYLHPSMLSEEVRAKADAQRAAIAEAEATVTASLEADFAAWEPEAEL
jgi:hypothetical protein